MNGVLTFFKKRLVDVGTGIVSSAIFAYFFEKEGAVELGSVAIGLISLPIFLLIGGVGVSLYGLYIVIHIIEVIAAKLHIFDVMDGM